MILLPAIDLYGGKAVRLYKGDYAQMTVYSERPTEVAADFAACGAVYIHMVDLEGARNGDCPNFETVAAVAKTGSLKVEIGGGIRSEDVIRRYLDAGVYRVILGTAAVTNPAFLETMAAKYGERLAVGVDLKDGQVAIHGWTKTSGLTGEVFCRRLQDIGVKTVICTDVSRDGAMGGTNRDLYRTLQAQFALDFVASGGVSSMEDILALKDLGLYGAILGKAYYTGAVDLRRALEAAR